MKLAALPVLLIGAGCCATPPAADQSNTAPPPLERVEFCVLPERTIEVKDSSRDQIGVHGK
ncbi:MAG: hypothetical protein M5U25_02310 [Planctomycetota bacterium]|nr:hypothetical protein [Planctomycetota bacterium]